MCTKTLPHFCGVSLSDACSLFPPFLLVWGETRHSCAWQNLALEEKELPHLRQEEQRRVEVPFSLLPSSSWNNTMAMYVNTWCKIPTALLGTEPARTWQRALESLVRDLWLSTLPYSSLPKFLLLFLGQMKTSDRSSVREQLSPKALDLQPGIASRTSQ